MGPRVQIASLFSRVVHITFGAAAALIVANIVFAFYLDRLPQSVMTTFGTGEQNILTWLSSALLLYCALALVSLGLLERQREQGQPAGAWRRWIELAAIFFLLSLDETAELHENLTDLLRAAYHLQGYLFFAWVIPGAAFALAVGARSVGLLRSLPEATRRRMLHAGAIYLAGAIGLEAVGADYTSRSGQVQDLTFQLLCTVEEGLEVLGLWWFLRALLPHAASLEQGAEPRPGGTWGALGLDLGRAAALGGAIVGLAALVAPQLIKLDPLKTADMIEAEWLVRKGGRDCETSLARIRPELTSGGISRNSVLKMIPLGPRPEQSFELRPPRPGRYRLELYMIRHRIFGQVSVLLDGRPLRNIDLSSESTVISSTGPIDLGVVELGPTASLTFRLLAPRRHYGFDGVRLTPVR